MKQKFVSIKKKFFLYCVGLVVCLFLIICACLATTKYCERNSSLALENYEIFSLFWNDLEDLNRLLYSYMQTSGTQTEYNIREKIYNLVSYTSHLDLEISDSKIEDLNTLTSGLELHVTTFLKMDTQKEAERMEEYTLICRYQTELESLKRNFYDVIEDYSGRKQIQMQKIQTLLWAALLFGSGVVFAYFVRYTHKITRDILNPVTDLTRQFQKIISGDNEIQLNYIEQEKDELDILENVFYRMVETNNRNMQELRDKAELEHSLAQTRINNANLRARLDRTKLRLLQSRVSPHFMFNTFNILAGMAIAENAECTRQFAVKTAKYFRYSLVSLDQVVHLKEEIENVRLYLEIQKVRFQGRLLTQLHIPNNCLNCSVPAMILQPFCENAIIHGMGLSSQPLKIHITAERRKKYLRITISDNGAGMNFERLCAVRQTLTEWEEYDDSDGIGVKNTFQRLQAYYCGQAQCRIESEKEKGTLIQLFLPTDFSAAKEAKYECADCR